MRLFLFLMFAVSLGWAEKWHTSPEKWKGPRIYHAEFDETYTERIAVSKATPPRRGLKKILSTNKAYWYGVIKKDEPPRETSIYIYNEREQATLIQIKDHYQWPVEVRWINEKLIYVAAFWGRILGTYFVFDVESETLVHKEMIHDGAIAFNQFQEAKLKQEKEKGSATEVVTSTAVSSKSFSAKQAREVIVRKKTLLTQFAGKHRFTKNDLPDDIKWSRDEAYHWILYKKRAVEYPIKLGNPYDVTIKRRMSGIRDVKILNKASQAEKFATEIPQETDKLTALPNNKGFLFTEKIVEDGIERRNVDFVDNTGITAERITEGPVSFLQYSPDSRFLLYEGVTLTDLTTNAKARTKGDFGFEGRDVKVIGWSKDGQKLALSVSEMGIRPNWTQLWLLELE